MNEMDQLQAAIGSLWSTLWRNHYYLMLTMLITLALIGYAAADQISSSGVLDSTWTTFEPRCDRDKQIGKWVMGTTTDYAGDMTPEQYQQYCR